MPQPIRPAVANRLLSSLPGSEYERLAPSLELIRLAFGEVLYELVKLSSMFISRTTR